MRYVLNVPRSWNERLEARAAKEGVPPRTWLVWCIRDALEELDDRLEQREVELEETVA
jgi:hypothetical protein